MFDRPQEQRPKNTGKVDNRRENIVDIETKSTAKYLYGIIIFLVIIILIISVFFIYDSNKKTSSNSENEIVISETTTQPTKIEEISFQELIGKYEGNIEGEKIIVNIFLEGRQKRYTYSKNKRLSYLLSHFPATNEINFHKPKQGLAEFRAFKEENSIVLRSVNVEFFKIK